jgi:hypothetical protein
MNFRLVRQSSVSLDRDPAVLQRAADELARNRINLDGLSALENPKRGVIRLRTNNAERAREVLDRIGVAFTETEVFEFDLPNRPGRLDAVCEALASAGVNVDYVYGTYRDSVQHVRIVLKASPIERAKAILHELPAD